MAERNRSRLVDAADLAVDALDGMEPDLRHLSGLMLALRTIGEASDAIEPAAISSLARCAGETLAELDRAWRLAHFGKARGIVRLTATVCWT